tara:strand:- start:187 stop:300 length:114 start_codon:yes stop_codon:yes gene_type:complete
VDLLSVMLVLVTVVTVVTEVSEWTVVYDEPFGTGVAA